MFGFEELKPNSVEEVAREIRDVVDRLGELDREKPHQYAVGHFSQEVVVHEITKRHCVALEWHAKGISRLPSSEVAEGIRIHIGTSFSFISLVQKLIYARKLSCLAFVGFGRDIQMPRLGEIFPTGQAS